MENVSGYLHDILYFFKDGFREGFAHVNGALGLLIALYGAYQLSEWKRIWAVALGATLVGVNNRDLRTFNVSLETSVSLAPHAHAGSLLVSESGIGGANEIAMLRAHGFQAFLVGETLMRAGQPEEALRALVNLQVL